MPRKTEGPTSANEATLGFVMARWPTRLDYALSDRAVSDIEHLTARATDLSKIIEAARALKPGLQTADILRTLSDKVGISVRDLRRVFNSLENTRDLADELGGPEQAIARLPKPLSPTSSTQSLTSQKRSRQPLLLWLTPCGCTTKTIQYP